MIKRKHILSKKKEKMCFLFFCVLEGFDEENEDVLSFLEKC